MSDGLAKAGSAVVGIDSALEPMADLVWLAAALDQREAPPALQPQDRLLPADGATLKVALKPLRRHGLRAAKAAGLGKRGLRRAGMVASPTGSGKSATFVRMVALLGPKQLNWDGLAEHGLMVATGNRCAICLREWAAEVGAGERGPPSHEPRSLALLPLGPSNRVVCESSRSSAGPSLATRLRRLVSAREVALEFVLGLIALWRRADPARFARALVLQLRIGRLWGYSRPARAPGRLVVASGHMTRGPDVSRMTEVLVIRGESLALT